MRRFGVSGCDPTWDPWIFRLEECFHRRVQYQSGAVDPEAIHQRLVEKEGFCTAT